MITYRKRLVSMIVCILAIILGFTHNRSIGLAAQTNFYASPVFSKAQTDPTLDYFSSIVTNGQTLPLAVDVTNTSTSETQHFRVSLAVATTTSEGKIDYTPNDKKTVPKKALTLLDLVPKEKQTQELTIEPDTTQTVTFDLTVPSEGISDTLLGSIFIHQLSTENPQNEPIGIQSEFATTLPVILKQAKAQQLPKLTIQHVSANATKVSATITNSKPVMFGKITLKTEIFRKNGNKALYQKTQRNLEMAPNSSFTHISDLSQTPLANGAYYLKSTVTSGSKTFRLTKSFTVDQKNNHQNQSTQLIQKNHPILFWLLSSLILLMLLIVILWALIKRTKNKSH